MKKLKWILGMALLCSTLSGCYVVPAGPPVGYYGPPVHVAFYGGGCCHRW